jgi:hypothetical protein
VWVEESKQEGGRKFFIRVMRRIKSESAMGKKISVTKSLLPFII